MSKRAPELLENISAMKEWRNAVSSTVGFVPTMGALHEGHAELLRQARKHSSRVVLSVFVNPAQFGKGEDLEKYPRTLEHDLVIARECGVDAVFFPRTEDMYPRGYSTYVREETLSSRLCGPFRPGHFQGVTTVVMKLFNIVQPHRVWFGLKDAQQFFVIQKMVRDLNLDLEVIGVPTVREPDGLAMSSRNRYLSPEERRVAPKLYEVLKKTVDLGAEGALAAAIERGIQDLKGFGFKVQYLEAFDASYNNRILAAAVYLGSTRLIDNMELSPSATRHAL